MAEIVLTFVTPLIEQAVSKATSAAAERVSLAWGLEDELEDLAKLLTVIQGVLQAAEERQENNQSIRNWLCQLENVAYDAVDVLDLYAYMVNQVKAETPSLMMRKVRTFVSPARLTMSSKIKKIKEALVKAKTDAVFIQLIQSSDQRGSTTRQYPKTDSILPVNLDISERKRDVLDIVKMLTELKSKHPLSGISVIGMAGVGKTTLAKSVYKMVNDRKDVYDLVAWVCVSENFNEQEILVEILEHFSGSGSAVGAINSMNVLLQELVNKIENKKFLLILDDVWNRDSKKWEDLKTRLLTIPGLEKQRGDIMRGTTSVTKISVLITTRDEEAASVLEKSIPMGRYCVKPLSKDFCWSIIKGMVLRSSSFDKCLPWNLEVIGQDIARKCGGVPLVASVIGGTLSRHIEVDKWLRIRANDAWEDRNKILSILKISFDHLRPPLRKCFSYCSLFPKDFVIDKDDLIQLWMAQGFLYQSNESTKTMEEVGEEYLDELLSYSLFQDVTRDHHDGSIISFKMHDIVHDLALFVSEGETLIWEPGLSINDDSNIRHLRVKGKIPPTIPRCVARRLHSLFLDADVLVSMPSNFKTLRCLRLQGANTKALPATLGKLKHLKYLNISDNGIRALPQPFSKLYNLQTLKLLNCYYHEKLPIGFTNLISLRHINVTYKEHLVDQLPSILSRGIGRLTSLQKLPVTLYDLGGDNGCRINELGHLKQLGGNLYIWNLEMVKSKPEATEANLKEKTKLNRLMLSWDGRNTKGKQNDEEILESLQPPSNLKHLSILGYAGETFPLWLTTASFQLNNLVELTFGNCNGCICLPGLGLLPNLQVLCLRRMENVRSMGHMLNLNNTSIAAVLYPKLKSLTLSSMFNLEEWVEVVEDATKGEEAGMIVFPCLEQVLIEDCPNLKIIPSGLQSRITFGHGVLNPEELEEFNDAIGSEESEELQDTDGSEDLEEHDEFGTDESEDPQDAEGSEGEEEEFEDADGSEELDESEMP